MALTTAAQSIAKTQGMESLPAQYWELVERYRGELMNQAHAILGSVEDAEDVVQETFCEALRDVRKLADVRSVGAWLRSVNKFNALTRLRERRRDSKRIIRKHNEAPERMVTTGGFSAVETQEAVTKAIEALPENLRSVVVLRYWEHLSYKEIAQRLQLPPGTVGFLLYDASVRLYDKLKIQITQALRPVGEQPPVEGQEDRSPTGASTI